MRQSKPNFFIIGAPKCGTTSLAYWLGEHPNIYMSKWKEPRYYDRDLRTRFRLSEAEYAALFREATNEHLAVGEATVWYLYSQQAVPLIEEELPGVRYLTIIRNPVAMAYSLHEQMGLHQMEHIVDFSKAWQMSPIRRQGQGVSRWLSEPRMIDYQSVCLIGEQLERLLNTVPQERVLVLVLDDLRENPRREYLNVLNFLGVSDDGRTDFSVRNPAKRVRSISFQKFLVVAQKGERVARGRLGLPPANSALFKILNNLNKTPRPRPEMHPDLRAQLQEFFRSDIERLERLLQRDFSNWHNVH